MGAEISEKEGRAEAPGAVLSTPVDSEVPEKAAKPEPAQKASVSDTSSFASLLRCVTGL